MTWLAVSFMLQHADPREPTNTQWPNFLQTGRIVDDPTFHLGARVAAFADPEGDNGSIEWGVGLTVQISVLMQP